MNKQSTSEQFSENAVFLVDQDGCVVVWNEGAQDFYGISSEDALLKPIAALVPLEDTAFSWRDIPEMLQEKVAAWYGHAIHFTREGERWSVIWRISPARNRAQEVIAYVCDVQPVRRVVRKSNGKSVNS